MARHMPRRPMTLLRIGPGLSGAGFLSCRSASESAALCLQSRGLRVTDSGRMAPASGAITRTKEGLDRDFEIRASALPALRGRALATAEQVCEAMRIGKIS